MKLVACSKSKHIEKRMQDSAAEVYTGRVMDMGFVVRHMIRAPY